MYDISDKSLGTIVCKRLFVKYTIDEVSLKFHTWGLTKRLWDDEASGYYLNKWGPNIMTHALTHAQQILSVTPCLLTQIRDLPHAASRYHARPKVKWFCMWINSRIRESKQGITNLSHAPAMCIACSKVSIALKEELSLKSGLNHRISTTMRCRIAASQELTGGWFRHWAWDIYMCVCMCMCVSCVCVRVCT